MKALATVALASVMALAAVAPAQARQGCGLGFHRIPNGRCVPNRPPVRQVVWVEGRYYPGHGYWYQNRWWHRRYRERNEWRYR
jgi:hypothetical protein